ncbi:LrgB family protein [Agaribacterium haliotis]|uniref:LrgB family protein n=1 Tax=Agaribacterium haliotis TaxID=2013869 RepID=UPI0013046DFE|nr:LrgB family protein [Agaribacterium haliotis]
MTEPLRELLVAVLMLGLTLGCFLLWRKLQRATAWAWLNPLLMSIASVILFLLLTGISYESYWLGGQVLGALVEPVVVALGYPLYKQRRLFFRHWRALLASSFIAVFLSLTSLTLLARLAGIDNTVLLSLVTLNVTTAVAMETSAAMGGLASLAAICVMIAGFTGVGLGQWALKRSGVSDERAVGIAIGAGSHALGAATLTARSMQSAAWASASLILCALLTALFAPHWVPFLLSL